MSRSSLPSLFFLSCLIPAVAIGAPITLSGTVTYDGSYNADSLYVAVLDSAGGEISPFEILAFDIEDSPVSQPYTFNLNNSTDPAHVLIAALLDVDGGGPDGGNDADVLGWYDSQPVAAFVSTATSQSGLDFSLPTGEIHGTVTFIPDQELALVGVAQHAFCFAGERLNRPEVAITSTGPYSLIGIYAGDYCIHACGYGTGTPPGCVCYGDYTCQNPTSVSVGEGEIVNGINVSFFNPTPAQPTTWGRLKARYP